MAFKINRAKSSAALSNAQQIGKKITAHALLNSETLPATLADAGITNSGDLTYQYTRNTIVSPNTFCLTTTSNGVSAHIAGTTNSVKNAVAGPCAGHTGIAPTVAANGEACPANYIVVPGSSLYDTKAFCVMKHEATNVAGVASSKANSGTPWVSISQTAAISTAAAACDGCHLITEAEWLTIAQNVMSVASNWSGGGVGVGSLYSGHNDNSPSEAVSSWADSNACYGTITAGTGANCSSAGAQQRTLTLTNGEIIWDFAGNVWEWTQGTTEGVGSQPGNESYSWRDWNNPVSKGNLSPNPFPSYANPAANSWSSGHGIGRVYGSSTEANLRAFLRSGNWSTGSNSGVFTLIMNNSPNFTNTNTGFRVAR